MWRAALMVITVTLGACGDDDKKPGDTADTSVEVDRETVADVDPDTTPEVTPPLASCVERPDALLVPPGATLPCELLPPGLTLTQ